jgi:glycosyl transferase family 25
MDLRYIKTYVINLDKNIEKFYKINENFSKLNIQAERFTGIYGKDLKQSYIDNITNPYVQYTIKNGRYIDSDIGTLGAIGCYLSHVSLWKKLISSRDNLFFILEDDAEPLKEYSIDYLNQYINKINIIDPNWDFIFLGWGKPDPINSINRDIKITEDIYKINEITFGLHSYLINKKGATKLLSKAFPIVHQLDSYISFMAMFRDLNSYRGKVSYIVQNNINSDIQTDKSIKIYFNRLDDKKLNYYIQNNTNIYFILLFVLILLYMIFKYFSSNTCHKMVSSS